MIMKWMEFGCGTPLLAEVAETRQHFFLFFPDFLFLPELVRLPHYLPRPAKAHLLAERVEVCQYFF